MPAKKFKYSRSVKRADRAFCERAADGIQKCVSEMDKQVVEIGQYLTDVKSRLKHGEFYRWLECYFPWSTSTVNRWMTTARKFGSVKQLNRMSFGATAMALLSQGNTPDAAFDEALERARKGEVITYATARDIIAKHRSRIVVKSARQGVAGAILPAVDADCDFSIGDAVAKVRQVYFEQMEECPSAHRESFAVACETMIARSRLRKLESA